MAETDLGQLNGLTGWVASVIESLGEIGVGLLVALENLVPPIPSEIVLALAGYLAGEGRVNVFMVLIAATAGSVVGAVVLYWLGYKVGEERLRRWLDRIPLVDADDLNKADRWFERHERSAVLFGRCAPVVRSLVSIPAGANRMPMGQFLLFTALGSGVWNALFIGVGYLLGERWHKVEQYSHWFDYAIGAFFVIVVASWVIKKARKRRVSSGPSRGGAQRRAAAENTDLAPNGDRAQAGVNTEHSERASWADRTARRDQPPSSPSIGSAAFETPVEVGSHDKHGERDQD